MNGVRMLRFPPPYRAALAFSNDVDDLLDPGGWWEYLRFLNTAENTRWGKGLEMEVGDSFWFWSDHGEEQPGSYFAGLTETPSPFAPLIASLGRAGYLDTLHTYGTFSRHGGFRREHAKIAARVLADEGFAPSVWVNHGGAHDFQNLWRGCGDVPENPEARGAPAPEYHLDLTLEMGIRFAWLGELTRVPGQDRPLILRDVLHPASPLRRDALAYFGRSLSRRLGYRDLLAQYPNYAVLENRLLWRRTLRDGNAIDSFVRYGDFARADFSDLAWLLRDYFLDTLEHGGGSSVVFLHWSRHPGRSFSDLDPNALQALRKLAERHREGRIWVTTTGRLLAYARAHRCAGWKAEATSEGTRIEVHDRRLPGEAPLGKEDLSGLAFRVPDPDRTRITWKGEPVECERHPADGETVWIPQPRLRFPAPPSGVSG